MDQALQFLRSWEADSKEAGASWNPNGGLRSRFPSHLIRGGAFHYVEAEICSTLRRLHCVPRPTQ